MKKSTVREISACLARLPLKECGDREMKISLILDRVHFRRLDSVILDDINALRDETMGDRAALVGEYVRLAQAGDPKAKDILPDVRGVMEDFDRAYHVLLSQDMDAEIPRKVDDAALIAFIVDKAPEMVDDMDTLLLNITGK